MLCFTLLLYAGRDVRRQSCVKVQCEVQMCIAQIQSVVTSIDPTHLRNFRSCFYYFATSHCYLVVDQTANLSFKERNEIPHIVYEAANCNIVHT